MSPYDNFIKFKVAKLDGEDLIAISLEGADKVLLDLSGVTIQNLMNYSDVDLSEGEIMFKVTQEDAQAAKKAVLTMANNSVQPTYTLSIQNGSDKTMIHHGTYNVLGSSNSKPVIGKANQGLTSATS